MSGLFGSTVIPGNRLTDMPQQTATVGIPIPFGYGKFPVDGNVIWAGEVEEHYSRKRQGKGGVKTEEWTYTCSYAIAFCKGPIHGYLTIKRDGKVVYTQDPNATIEDLEYSQKWLEKATFYYGTDTQLPDSTIEAAEGAGQVSAFRYLAYIVVEDDDVTTNGGAVPSYEAVVIRGAAKSYTSPPYPVYVEDSLGVDGVSSGGSGNIADEAHLDVSSIALDGLLRPVLLHYDYEPPDEMSVASSALDGILVQVLKTYEHQPPDELTVMSEPLDGDLDVVLVEYENYAPEGVDVSSIALDGDLA